MYLTHGAEEWEKYFALLIRANQGAAEMGLTGSQDCTAIVKPSPSSCALEHKKLMEIKKEKEGEKRRKV